MRTDLRVRRFPNLVRLDVTHPGPRPSIRGVDFTEVGFRDDGVVRAALNNLNAHLATWPNEPVTLDDVRALA